MADTQNPGTQQPGPIRPPYFPQDPISFILMVPLLPLIFFMQSLSSMMMPAGLQTISSSAMPAMPMAQGSSNQYKNNEEWEIWEEGGKLKVRVHRDARRE